MTPWSGLRTKSLLPLIQKLDLCARRTPKRSHFLFKLFSFFIFLLWNFVAWFSVVESIATLCLMIFCKMFDFVQWIEIWTYSFFVTGAIRISWSIGKIKSYSHSTMLQKLSKCEVKAWLCWNMITLLPLQFYVKSNFSEFKWSKNVLYGNIRDAELWILVNLGLQSCSNLLKIENAEPLKFPKTTFLDHLNSLKFDFT